MSDSPNPDAGMSPQDNDVVVTCNGMSDVRYTVRQFPGVAQISASTRDEALQIARSFAQKQAVNVWYAENGAHRLLEHYRARAADGRPVRKADT